MEAITVVKGTTPTLLVAAKSWTVLCDIYNDSDTDMRVVYDGTVATALVATPAGSEVGVKLAAGGVLELSKICVPELSKDVYAVHAADADKRAQIQKR